MQRRRVRRAALAGLQEPPPCRSSRAGRAPVAGRVASRVRQRAWPAQARPKGTSGRRARTAAAGARAATCRRPVFSWAKRRRRPPARRRGALVAQLWRNTCTIVAWLWRGLLRQSAGWRDISPLGAIHTNDTARPSAEFRHPRPGEEARARHTSGNAYGCTSAGMHLARDLARRTGRDNTQSSRPGSCRSGAGSRPCQYECLRDRAPHTSQKPRAPQRPHLRGCAPTRRAVRARVRVRVRVKGSG